MLSTPMFLHRTHPLPMLNPNSIIYYYKKRILQ